MARHWVMRVAAAAGIGGPTNQLIEVLTGELVSEAVRHGEADASIRVGLEIYDAGVRVAVTGLWVPAHPSSKSLALVEVLSNGWGALPGPDGERTVWFDLDITG
jgi:serine/threonine-protein kinase RsbW